MLETCSKWVSQDEEKRQNVKRHVCSSYPDVILSATSTQLDVSPSFADQIMFTLSELLVAQPHAHSSEIVIPSNFKSL